MSGLVESAGHDLLAECSLDVLEERLFQLASGQSGGGYHIADLDGFHVMLQDEPEGACHLGMWHGQDVGAQPGDTSVTGRYKDIPGTGCSVSGTSPTLYVNYFGNSIQLSPVSGMGTVFSIR